MKRRDAIRNVWIVGAALMGVTAAWTSWELLQPLPTTGFGGKVRTISPDAVPEGAVVAVPAAKAYLTKIDGELVAISEKCTHLGCRVPWCDSSGQFECPCHGSQFNRAGDYRIGPAPRGMDRHPIEIGAEDGLVYIDTGERIEGPPPGGEQIDEPKKGPSCSAEGE